MYHTSIVCTRARALAYTHAYQTQPVTKGCPAGYYLTGTGECRLCATAFGPCDLCTPGGCFVCSSGPISNYLDPVTKKCIRMFRSLCLPLSVSHSFMCFSLCPSPLGACGDEHLKSVEEQAQPSPLRFVSSASRMPTSMDSHVCPLIRLLFPAHEHAREPHTFAHTHLHPPTHTHTHTHTQRARCTDLAASSATPRRARSVPLEPTTTKPRGCAGV